MMVERLVLRKDKLMVVMMDRRMVEGRVDLLDYQLVDWMVGW